MDDRNDYERGFIDGMSHQAKSSVDKAVNAMSKREWVGLTEDEIFEAENSVPDSVIGDRNWCIYFAHVIEAKLKEKNT